MARYPSNTRYNKLRSLWTKHKLGARLKVLVVVVAVVFIIKPLRNLLVPGWPKSFEDLSTFKVAYIHLHDLFFHVDRSPYTGSCDFVHKKLENVKMPVLGEMPFYKPEVYLTFARENQDKFSKEEASIIYNYQQNLKEREQQQMLYAMFSITQALTAFNVSYFLSEGSLIGYWRHHGLTPWDDDVDMMIDAEKWPIARKVLSCLPDLQLNMGSDYMWKVFHKDSDLWEGEDFLKFPFIDVFLYRKDDEHVWPLTIWLKTTLIAPVSYVFPTQKGVFESWPVSVPYRTGEFLELEYGPGVMSDCYSRTFKRRERFLVPVGDRTHLRCSVLAEVYPFVRRIKRDKATHTVLEERVLATQILSTFNTTYRDELRGR